jgi:hypothetical protein
LGAFLWVENALPMPAPFPRGTFSAATWHEDFASPRTRRRSGARHARASAPTISSISTPTPNDTDDKQPLEKLCDCMRVMLRGHLLPAK